MYFDELRHASNLPVQVSTIRTLAILLYPRRWKLVVGSIVLSYYQPRWVMATALMIWRAYIIPICHVTGLSSILYTSKLKFQKVGMASIRALLQTRLGQQLVEIAQRKIHNWISKLHTFTEAKVYQGTSKVLDHLRKTMKDPDMPDFIHDAIDETIDMITPDVMEEVSRKTNEILLYYRSFSRLQRFSSPNRWHQGLPTSFKNSNSRNIQNQAMNQIMPVNESRTTVVGDDNHLIKNEQLQRHQTSPGSIHPLHRVKRAYSKENSQLIKRMVQFHGNHKDQKQSLIAVSSKNLDSASFNELGTSSPARESMTSTSASSQDPSGNFQVHNCKSHNNHLLIASTPVKRRLFREKKYHLIQTIINKPVHLCTRYCHYCCTVCTLAQFTKVKYVSRNLCALWSSTQTRCWLCNRRLARLQVQAIRHKFRYTLTPYDRSIWNCVKDPWWLALNAIGVIPKVGVLWWFFLFTIRDLTDEHQVAEFISGFQTARFLSQGCWGNIRGTFWLLWCAYTAEDNFASVEIDCKTPTMGLIDILLFLLQILLVSATFYKLSQSKRMSYAHGIVERMPTHLLRLQQIHLMRRLHQTTKLEQNIADNLGSTQRKNRKCSANKANLNAPTASTPILDRITPQAVSQHDDLVTFNGHRLDNSKLSQESPSMKSKKSLSSVAHAVAIAEGFRRPLKQLRQGVDSPFFSTAANQNIVHANDAEKISFMYAGHGRVMQSEPGNSGGHLFKLFLYDVAVLVIVFVLVALVLLTAPNESMHEQMHLRNQDIQGLTISIHNMTRSTTDWRLWSKLYWIRVVSGFLAFPFIFFKIPVLNTLLLHTSRTGYDRKGRTVPVIKLFTPPND